MPPVPGKDRRIIETIFNNFLFSLQQPHVTQITPPQPGQTVAATPSSTAASHLGLELALFQQLLSLIEPTTNIFQPYHGVGSMKTSINILALALITHQPLVIIEELLLQFEKIIIELNRQGIDMNSPTVNNILDTTGTTFFEATFILYWPLHRHFIFNAILLHYPALTSLTLTIFFPTHTLLCATFTKQDTSDIGIFLPQREYIYRQSILGHIFPSYLRYDKLSKYILLHVSQYAHYEPKFLYLQNKYPALYEGKFDHSVKQRRAAAKQIETFPIQQLFQDNVFKLPITAPNQIYFKDDYSTQWLSTSQFTFYNNDGSSLYLRSYPSPTNTRLQCPQQLHNIDGNYRYAVKLWSNARNYNFLGPLGQYVETMYQLPPNSLIIYNIISNGLLSPRIIDQQRWPFYKTIHPTQLTTAERTIYQYYPFLSVTTVWNRYIPTPLPTKLRLKFYPLLDIFLNYIAISYKYLSLLTTDTHIEKGAIIDSNGVHLVKEFFLPIFRYHNLIDIYDIIVETITTVLHENHLVQTHFPPLVEKLGQQFNTLRGARINTQSSIIPLTIFALATLLPPTDEFIMPYFISMLPYQWNEDGTVQLLDSSEWYKYESTLDDITNAVFMLMSDMISHPKHFYQKVATQSHNNHQNLVDKVLHSQGRLFNTNPDDDDEPIELIASATYQIRDDQALHQRPTTDIPEENEQDNNFSLISFLLTNHNIENSDEFLTLLLHTQQFELTQPITILNPTQSMVQDWLVNSTNVNSSNNVDNLKYSYETLLKSEPKQLKSSLLLSTLIIRRYSAQILNYFMNLDIDWDYYDDYNLTILDYCILANTYSYAPNFVKHVVRRTNCHPLGLDPSDPTEHFQNRWTMLRQHIIMQQRISPEVEKYGLTEIPQLYTFSTALLMFLPCDEQFPTELLHLIITKELYDQSLTPTGELFNIDTVSDFEHYIELYPTLSTSIDFCQLNIFPFLLLLFFTRCPNIVQRHEAWLTSLLLQYIQLHDINKFIPHSKLNHQDEIQLTLLPANRAHSNDDEDILDKHNHNDIFTRPLRDGEIESLLSKVQTNSTPIPFAQQSHAVKLTIFDRIYLVYHFIDTNFHQSIIEKLFRVIPISYCYFLYYFYKLPSDLTLQLLATTPEGYSDAEVPLETVSVDYTHLSIPTFDLSKLSPEYYHLLQVEVHGNKLIDLYLSYAQPIFQSTMVDASRHDVSNFLYARESTIEATHKFEKEQISLLSTLLKKAIKSLSKKNGTFAFNEIDPSSIDSTLRKVAVAAVNLHHILKFNIQVVDIQSSHPDRLAPEAHLELRRFQTILPQSTLPTQYLNTIPSKLLLHDFKFFSEEKVISLAKKIMKAQKKSDLDLDELIAEQVKISLPKYNQEYFESFVQFETVPPQKSNMSPTLFDLALNKPRSVYYIELMFRETPLTALLQLSTQYGTISGASKSLRNRFGYHVCRELLSFQALQQHSISGSNLPKCADIYHSVNGESWAQSANTVLNNFTKLTQTNNQPTKIFPVHQLSGASIQGAVFQYAQSLLSLPKQTPSTTITPGYRPILFNTIQQHVMKLQSGDTNIIMDTTSLTEPTNRLSIEQTKSIPKRQSTQTKQQNKALVDLQKQQKAKHSNFKPLTRYNNIGENELLSLLNADDDVDYE